MVNAGIFVGMQARKLLLPYVDHLQGEIMWSTCENALHNFQVSRKYWYRHGDTSSKCFFQVYAMKAWHDV